MFEKVGVTVAAAILTYALTDAFWRGRFQYRFGPIVERRNRPLEYWGMMAVFTFATCTTWAITLMVWRK